MRLLKVKIDYILVLLRRWRSRFHYITFAVCSENCCMKQIVRSMQSWLTYAFNTINTNLIHLIAYWYSRGRRGKSLSFYLLFLHSTRYFGTLVTLHLPYFQKIYHLTFSIHLHYYILCRYNIYNSNIIFVLHSNQSFTMFKIFVYFV